MGPRRLVIPALAMAVSALLLPGPGGGAAVPHDLHIVYADLAVEEGVVAGRIRFFQDDLERALGSLLGATAHSLQPGAEADSLVLSYLRAHLELEVAGTVLVPELLGSGQDRLDREPVWWILVQFRAAAPVEEVRVRNTLLFEVFEDQRNIMKFVHFPDETPQTHSFARGESERRVRFPASGP